MTNKIQEALTVVRAAASDTKYVIYYVQDETYCWLYVDQYLQPVSFDSVDVGLLEDALSSVENIPAIYEVQP